MNIIVCYKITPDEQDIIIAPDRNISLEKAALKIGDYDLNAIEAGARLAADYDTRLIGLTVGGDVVDDSKLKKSLLARGPNELIIFKDAALPQASSGLTAIALSAALSKIESFDLILCGEGSADRYSQQVGIQLGEVLNVPVINSVSEIELREGFAYVTRLTETHVEHLEVALPAVLCVIADMNVPRIPSMKDILSAGKKPSLLLGADDVQTGDLTDPVQIISVLAPEQTQRACAITESTDDENIKAFFATVQIKF
ncbi:MAG: putative electron transfer flavoprotein FixA [Coriobacteriales bacterium]|nr:putative electron transfer flavoprotein FixA [Coriobacteriales bacterium]